MSINLLDAVMLVDCGNKWYIVRGMGPGIELLLEPYDAEGKPIVSSMDKVVEVWPYEGDV